jgi:peroxiredoxin Q/BCP
MNVRLSLLLAIVTFAVVALGADAPLLPVEGTPAPAFTLATQDGSKVSLEQLKGKWVVLYFYPKDFTSGCTLEAQRFQRDAALYEKQNAIVLGVSFDSADSHKDFCAKERLTFKLLADADHAVANKYGSVMINNGTEYAARNTFLIDPSGTIRKVYPKVKPTGHSEEVLADLSTLQAAK